MKNRTFTLMADSLPPFLARWLERLSQAKGRNFVDLKCAIDAPYIKHVNLFIEDFAASPEQSIEFSADDLLSNQQPLLSALRNLDYDKIRLRLRAMSSLNPIVNAMSDEGSIQCLMRGVEMKFRSIFSTKGRSITLVKLTSSAGSAP